MWDYLKPAGRRANGKAWRKWRKDARILSHDAMLLSRNLVDFVKVPGLRVENWLD